MPACFHAQRLPVGVSFCDCNNYSTRKQSFSCKCGEDLDVHEWAWDSKGTTSATVLSLENREVRFHQGYSSGTAAVRGNSPCTAGHVYYWEIKMLTPLYGTDVMVGVGTAQVNLTKSAFRFCSLLGSDEESWGYSYNGKLHHNGKFKTYGPPFGKGSIVGVHLDMWRGKLTFYLNRECLGTAFTSIKAHELYPMVSSTAAQSAMRVIYSFSCPSSLQLLCMQSLSSSAHLMKEMCMVPGLKARMQKAFWWLTPAKDDQNQQGDAGESESGEEFDDLSEESDAVSVPLVVASNSTVGKSQSTASYPPTKRRRLPVTAPSGEPDEPVLATGSETDRAVLNCARCEIENITDLANICGRLTGKLCEDCCTSHKKLCLLCDVIL